MQLKNKHYGVATNKQCRSNRSYMCLLKLPLPYCPSGKWRVFSQGTRITGEADIASKPILAQPLLSEFAKPAIIIVYVVIEGASSNVCAFVDNDRAIQQIEQCFHAFQ